MPLSSPTPEGSASLTVINRIDEIIPVSEWLEQASAQFELDAKTTFKLDLVLNEALMNIVNYAYQDDSSHEIILNLLNWSEHVTLEIIDGGAPFNPFIATLPPTQSTLESALPNGRGILLIKSFTDAQEYSYNGKLNIMRVTICKPPVPDRQLIERSA